MILRLRPPAPAAGRARRLAGPIVVAALIAALTPVLAAASPPRPAAAESEPIGEDLVIIGRGWGHGRGMGQYGALGYALDGWSSARILDHFYGGTTAGAVPAAAPVDPDQVRVELRALRDRPTTVALTTGVIALRDRGGTLLAEIGDGAVRLVASGGGFEVQRGPSCAGPWVTQGLVAASEVHLSAPTPAPGAGADGLLQGCGPSYRAWYEGTLVAVTADGRPRTVNVVTIDQYLRGVVPNEMPALWPAAALEAQAVAARSYAMAGDTRQWPYADTCDTARCQVYDGAFTERNGSLRSSHHARTDAAVAATSGLVRLVDAGTADERIARTEFSSSTGGHTAGGDFPAVVDRGDDTPTNPNHLWTTRVPRATIEARYGLGRLRSAQVATRDGRGEDGGRALQVRFDFDRGTVFETGDRVRLRLGLKSSWFSFGSGSGAELRTTPVGRFIDRAYQELGGRPATNAELVAWQDAVVDGDRRALTAALAADRHFVGVLVDDLYRTTLGRSPDGVGRRYWTAEIDDGLTVASVGALFYASDEYYERAGMTDTAFVTALYRDLLGRDPDGEGLAYWRDMLGRSQVRRIDIAAGFYASPESRQFRVSDLHRRLLGTEPATDERAALADRLQTVDERTLAAEIAASGTGYRTWSRALTVQPD